MEIDSYLYMDFALTFLLSAIEMTYPSQKTRLNCTDMCINSPTGETLSVRCSTAKSKVLDWLDSGIDYLKDVRRSSSTQKCGVSFEILASVKDVLDFSHRQLNLDCH